MKKEDLAKLQPFDVLLMSGGDVLSMLIRTCEIQAYETREGHPIKGIIDGLKEKANQGIPIHSRMVYAINDPKAPFQYTGCEMTWPKPRLCDLTLDCDPVVLAYRCPLVKGLEADFKEYWDAAIAGKAYYGVDNLVTFNFNNVPVDQRHPVCSQEDTQAFLTVFKKNKILTSDYFPSYFYNSNSEVGKVSPYDQMEVFDGLKWRITF